MEKTTLLKDGTEVLIRTLREDDAGRSLAFFQSLPATDRIYLRNDVTRHEVVEERIRAMRTGRILRLVAVNSDDEIVADGSLESEGYAWKDHVAELRLGVIADAHDGDIALDADPFMLFRILQIGHCFLRFSSWVF